MCTSWIFKRRATTNLPLNLGFEHSYRDCLLLRLEHSPSHLSIPTFLAMATRRVRSFSLDFFPCMDGTCQTHARCVRLPRESIFVNGRIICLSTVLYSNGRFVCLHVVDILTVFFHHRCRFPENSSDKSSSHFWRDLLCVSFL